MQAINEGAYLLALRQNGRTGLFRMDKFADQATEMETGIWHDDFPFLKSECPLSIFAQ